MSVLGVNLSIPRIAVQGGGGGGALPPPYDPGEVQHPGDASLVRSTDWSDGGAATGTKFTFAMTFTAGAAITTWAYRAKFGRLSCQSLNNRRLQFQAKNTSDVSKLIWQSEVLDGVSQYLVAGSFDMDLIEADGMKIVIVKVSDGTIPTKGAASTWVQGDPISVHEEPYGIWGNDNGTNPFDGKSVYQAYWPHEFTDVEANIGAFYIDSENLVRDPLNQAIDALIGAPVFCLQAPAANYNAGVNRAVPGDALTKIGAGTFTDV